MTTSPGTNPAGNPGSAGPALRPAVGSRLRVWHLTLAPVLVAVAAANIRDQRISDPFLLSLAIGGFVLYAALGWALWRLLESSLGRSATAQRWAGRVRLSLPTGLLLLYLILMGTLFLVATVIYLVLEAQWRP